MFARRRWRGVGIVVAQLADVTFGDPEHGHPVAGFGWCAAALEKLTYRDSRAAGALHTGVLLGALAVAGTVAQRSVRGPALAALTAAVTWASLGGTTLGRTGDRVADLLAAGDIDGARALLPSLCGRDPSVLDIEGLARAALESVAENTSDAHVAPLLWAAVGGVPG
ncbi:cobalamin biosynthesis protein, partial [Mycobacterium sp. shizuoka-1]|uniref:cobalamin biosynthesis protein n=1 Tax=Mycobacterium sp. shizuoka-1 TaxID=2039281 RepID=UPI0018EC07A4